MTKKSAIVDKVTVAAQDARVKKTMKLGTWFSERSLEPLEVLDLDWLELDSNRKLLFKRCARLQEVCIQHHRRCISRSREGDWDRRLMIGDYPVS